MFLSKQDIPEYTHKTYYPICFFFFTLFAFIGIKFIKGNNNFFFSISHGP